LEYGFSFVLRKDQSEALAIDSLFYPFSVGLHRLLVEINEDEYVNVSQTDVIRFLLKNNFLDPWKNSTVETAGSIAHIKDIIVVKDTDNVVKSYELLTHSYQTAAAVVNEKGELISTLSSSDLRQITPELLKDMKFLSVRKFLLYYRSELRKPIVTTEDEKLIDQARKIVQNKVHRVWIVDNDKKPYGVLSLSGIFSVLSGYEKNLELIDKLDKKIETFGEKINFPGPDGKILTAS
jgi:5'-AMP-activated protein kinase regulatory gamma subunit